MSRTTTPDSEELSLVMRTYEVHQAPAARMNGVLQQNPYYASYEATNQTSQL